MSKRRGDLERPNISVTPSEDEVVEIEEFPCGRGANTQLADIHIWRVSRPTPRSLDLAGTTNDTLNQRLPQRFAIETHAGLVATLSVFLGRQNVADPLVG